MAKSVADLSQAFAVKKEAEKEERKNLVEATGLGVHQAFGEKHTRAKLTDALAQQIRREYWATGGLKTGGATKKGEHKEGSVGALATKYEVSVSTLGHLVGRLTWVHLPRVEGEPEENLKNLSQQELKTKKKAKELGVEPVRSKLGRLALPPDVVAKLRAETSAKMVATKSKKNSPAGE